jgi:hypothetical protein
MSNYETYPGPEYRFFLFDPEWDGLMFFKSEADRAVAVKTAIDAYKDVDNGWSEEVELLCMGEVTHVCTQTNIVNRPLAEELDKEGCDKDGEYWGSDIELRCNYEMLPMLKPEAKPTAWRYRDATGTHFTEDFQEIMNTPGIEEWTELLKQCRDHDTRRAAAVAQCAAMAEEIERLNATITALTREIRDAQEM